MLRRNPIGVVLAGYGILIGSLIVIGSEMYDLISGKGLRHPLAVAIAALPLLWALMARVSLSETELVFGVPLFRRTIQLEEVGSFAVTDNFPALRGFKARGVSYQLIGDTSERFVWGSGFLSERSAESWVDTLNEHLGRVRVSDHRSGLE